MSARWQTGRTPTSKSSTSSERAREHKRISSTRRDSRERTFETGSSSWRREGGSRTCTVSRRCGNSEPIPTKTTANRNKRRTVLCAVLCLSLLGGSIPTVDGAPGVSQARPAVELGNQTLTNRTVTVDSVTLPDGGYVVIHGGRYVFDGRPDPLGVSSYLNPGTHRNVTVHLSPERFSPGATGRIAAVLYHDNGDEQFTRFDEGGAVDRPYTVGGEPVEETATVERGPESTESRAPSAIVTTTEGSSPSPPETGTRPSPGPLQLVGLFLGGAFAVAAVLVLVTGRRGGTR